VTGTEAVARSLGLRRTGREYVGKCPSCGYASGFAVTEREGRILLFCAAGGCDQRDLWAALRKAGLVPESEEKPWEPKRRKRNKPAAADEPPISDTSKKIAVLAIWQRARPADGTVVASYLRSRGYTGPIPSVLRCGWGKHPATGDRYHPMMVAGVALQGTLDNGVAVHRTFLRPDGRGKADLEPSKMTLGPSKGGAVPLAPAGPVLAVSEGIENGLIYLQVTGIPTWAALSTAGLRSLILPPDVGEVVIACDPDVPGIRAAHTAALRWLREGRRVRIARPPVGQDFNDLLRAS
jgi:putative DNA primase/helicase